MSDGLEALEALLGVEDPMERRLALKSRQVTPYHLRIALRDEDPEVREAAALHPALTPELIRETFQGDDDYLKQVILEHRGDLGSDELEALVEDPGWSNELRDHPALTPDQRQRLNGLPGSDHVQDLVKNIGHITYPMLGEGSVHNPGAYFPEGRYAAHKAWGARNAIVVSEGEAGATMHNQHSGSAALDPTIARLSIIARPGKEADPGNSMNEAIRHRLFGALPGNRLGGLEDRVKNIRAIKEQRGPALQVEENKKLHATEGHEVQHGVYARLGQRYGHEGRDKILRATLRRLPNDLRSHYKVLFGPFKVGYPDPADHPEEAIGFLQNYLQDPTHRHKVHVSLRKLNDPDWQRESVQKARKTWQALQQIGRVLRPEDVGVEDRSDPMLLRSWGKQLQKSRGHGSDSVEDHLGYDGEREAAMAGVRLLTGKDLDPAILRARLHDCDGDIVEAALLAAGLEHEQRPALEAVLKLREMSKAEDRVPEVRPAGPDSVETATQLQLSFADGEVEQVRLGGKHSAGTLMARDRDGNLLLVKPGSGKQSPAAGASEEPASQSRRECAFWACARAWGLSRYIPKAELVSIDGREVAVFKMLGLDWTGLARAAKLNPALPRQALKPYLDDGTLHHWACLDYVLGNPDRHGNNIMVGPADEHHPLALIDHGSAFAGPSFDPGHDKNSFVPYYLRVWGPDRGWSKLSPAQRINILPRLSADADRFLKAWVAGISTEDLMETMSVYGIRSQACVDRLKKLQDEVARAESSSHAINALWVLT